MHYDLVLLKGFYQLFGSLQQCATRSLDDQDDVGEVPVSYLVRLVVELKSLPTDFQVFDHLLHGKLFAGFVNNVVNL